MKKFFALSLVLSLLLSAAAFADVAVHWRGVDKESSLTFTQGEGRGASNIISFASEMTFEPDRPAESSLTLYADLAYVFLSPQAFADPAVRQALDVAASLGGGHTTGAASAVLTSTQIRKVADGRYIMDGTLSINGRSQPVQFPFAASISSYFDLPKLTLEGAFTFNPQKFADGTKLAAPEGLDQATIAFRLAATPAP